MLGIHESEMSSPSFWIICFLLFFIDFIALCEIGAYLFMIFYWVQGKSLTDQSFYKNILKKGERRTFNYQHVNNETDQTSAEMTEIVMETRPI